MSVYPKADTTPTRRHTEPPPPPPVTVSQPPTGEDIRNLTAAIRELAAAMRLAATR